MKNNNIMLEVLRSIAVLMVVFLHFSLASNDIPRVLKVIIETVSNYGVPLFFIISGFLLSASLEKILLNNKSTLYSVKFFYIKRILRIYPAYLVSIFIISLFDDIEYIDILYHIFNVHNFFDGYNRSINAVYWSLSVEFQWYVVAPILIFIQLIFQKWVAILFFLFLFFISVFYRFYAIDDYLNKIISIGQLVRLAQDQSYIHLFNFSIGILVYRFRFVKVIFNKFFIIIYLFILIVLGYYYFDYLDGVITYNRHDMINKLLFSYYSSMVFLGLFVHSLLGLDMVDSYIFSPLKNISLVSYSLYIYHFPILSYVLSYGAPWYYSLLAYIVNSYLLALLSYFFIEKYFLNFSKKNTMQ